MTAAPVRSHRGRFTRDDCRLDDFRAVVEVETDPTDYPHPDRVERGVLFYGETLADDVATPVRRRAVQAELARALMDWRAQENDSGTETFVAELAAQTERRRSSLAR